VIDSLQRVVEEGRAQSSSSDPLRSAEFSVLELENELDALTQGKDFTAQLTELPALRKQQQELGNQPTQTKQSLEAAQKAEPADLELQTIKTKIAELADSSNSTDSTIQKRVNVLATVSASNLLPDAYLEGSLLLRLFAVGSCVGCTGEVSGRISILLHRLNLLVRCRASISALEVILRLPHPPRQRLQRDAERHQEVGPWPGRWGYSKQLRACELVRMRMRMRQDHGVRENSKGNSSRAYVRCNCKPYNRSRSFILRSRHVRIEIWRLSVQGLSSSSTGYLAGGKHSREPSEVMRVPGAARLHSIDHIE
jgi:hypothetical protein